MISLSKHADVTVPMSLVLLLVLAWLSVDAASSQAQHQRQMPEAPSEILPDGPRPEKPADRKVVELPGVRVNLEERFVEMPATVILREGEWLELVACTPGGREHESIVTIATRPSYIHLGLLMLDLEPGRPFAWEEKDGEIVIFPPVGPKVAAFYVYEKEGEMVEVPVTDWVLNTNTKKAMTENEWLFTGSVFVEIDGKQVYLADLNGNILSLVNFGDDLLVRATKKTDRDDDGMYNTYTERIPPVGTQLIVRLRPIDENKDAAEPENAEQADGN